jgi:cell division transport system permease protein
MQLRYVFTELGQGLRRNLSMHISVILTLFVSLTLVGVGVLLNEQSKIAAEHWGSQLEITVFLCNSDDLNPACSSEVTPAQKAALLEIVEANPEVAGYHLESQEVALEKAKERFGPEPFEGPRPAVTAEDLQESVWIELKDPEKFEGITSAVVGLDGVSKVRDARDLLKTIFDAINLLKTAALATAAFLVFAALLQVANTIRLAALARRREIGIMRLVGASTLYIALPFLMEALVTALIGIGLSGAALAAFVKYGVSDVAASRLKFMPWVSWGEYGLAMTIIAIIAPLLTVIPTLVLTRKYLKV